MTMDRYSSGCGDPEVWRRAAEIGWVRIRIFFDTGPLSARQVKSAQSLICIFSVSYSYFS